MPRVFRIEDAEGVGPYQGNPPGSLPLIDEHVDDPHKPAPYDDGLGDYPPGKWRDVRFGFTSLEQMQAWFATEEERRELANAGYRVAVYEAHPDRHMLGGHQCIFDLTRAEKVETIPVPVADTAQMSFAV